MRAGRRTDGVEVARFAIGGFWFCRLVLAKSCKRVLLSAPPPSLSFMLFLSVTLQVLASQLLLVDEVMKAGKQMGQAPPGGPGGMMEE